MTDRAAAPGRRTFLKGSAAAALGAAACAAPTPARPGASGAAASAEFTDAVETARLIRSGEMTALEAVDAAIARAEQVEPQLNGIASPTYDDAREAARGGVSGPFAGTPTFLKDLADREGQPTLYGSRAFRGYIAPKDDLHVAAWRRAGLVSLGKSTSPEMGLISSTEPLVTGATRNPWDLSRIPGGSSGGSAALVAAGVVPMAQASDGGGSIRIPAACCGLFGFKPSAGRLLHNPAPPEGVPEIAVEHAVSWTVRDSVAAFDAAQAQGRGYPAFEAPSGASAQRLRIAMDTAALSSDGETGPETVAAIEDAGRLLESLGHTVVEDSLPVNGDQFGDDFLLLWAAGAAEFAEAASRFSGKAPGPDILEPWTLSLAGDFMQRREALPDAVRRLFAFAAAYDAWFVSNGYDAFLSPVVATPAPPIGEQAPDGDFDTVMRNVLAFAGYTSPMNVSGAPSMSVPLGMSADGLPIGVMLSGRRGADEGLFALAFELEDAAPWIGRRPPVFAL